LRETNAATISRVISPPQFRRWEEPRNAGADPLVSTGGGLQADDNLDDAKAKEELRRRAREWVNMTVPMQTVDDEDKSQTTPPDSTKNFDIWDSDEEGVATRMRQEAQPEAGAGADEPTPFFMQVLAKQFGKT
jgi:hypothetical protein